MWTGDIDSLRKRYHGVTEVDVGGKWVEWFGSEGTGEKQKKSRDEGGKVKSS